MDPVTVEEDLSQSACVRENRRHVLIREGRGIQSYEHPAPMWAG